MLNGFYMSAAGMITQAQRVDVIANNIANVNTTGFKKDAMTFSEMYNESIYERRSGDKINDVAYQMSGGVLLDSTNTLFSPGSFRHTGSDFNLAIQGQGFFKLANDEDVMYTRAGLFEVSPDGYLINYGNNLRVQNTNDSPIYVGGSKFKVLRDGTVLLDGAPSSRIKLVDFNNRENLRKVGSNMFRVIDQEPEQDVVQTNVFQGYLEESNADGISEMVELINASRAYQMNASFIQTQDGALRSTINTLGRVG